MAIAFVKQTVGSVAATLSTTFSCTSTAGNLLVLFTGRSGGLTTGALTGVTDSASQTWTLATRGSVSGGVNTRIECWYMPNSAAVTTVTLNSATSQIYTWNVSEWSGVAAVSPLDSATPDPSHGATSTAQVTPALVTTGPADLVLAALHCTLTTSTFNGAGSAPTTGWTSLTDWDDAGTSGRAAYQVLPAGTYDAAWTLGTTQQTGQAGVSFLAVPVVMPPQLLISDNVTFRSTIW